LQTEKLSHEGMSYTGPFDQKYYDLSAIAAFSTYRNGEPPLK
jgi:hypothetical protein